MESNKEPQKARFEFRKLTEDWINPEFNRRKTDDRANIQSIPAGTTLAVRCYEKENGNIYSVDALLATDDGINIVPMGARHVSQLRGLLANTVVHQVTTWDEFRLWNGDTPSAVSTNREVLNLLWADPEVRRKVEDAFDAVMLARLRASQKSRKR